MQCCGTHGAEPHSSWVRQHGIGSTRRASTRQLPLNKHNAPAGRPPAAHPVPCARRPCRSPAVPTALQGRVGGIAVSYAVRVPAAACSGGRQVAHARHATAACSCCSRGRSKGVPSARQEGSHLRSTLVSAAAVTMYSRPFLSCSIGRQPRRAAVRQCLVQLLKPPARSDSKLALQKGAARCHEQRPQPHLEE